MEPPLRGEPPVDRLRFLNALTESSPRLETPPPGIRTPLHPHQLAALEEMRRRESGPIHRETSHGTLTVRAGFGILGDIPGYGKTLTLLAHVAQMMAVDVPRLETVIHLEPDAMARVRLDLVPTPTPAVDCGVTLVVVPSRLVGQWLEEIQTHTCLTVAVYPHARAGVSVHLLLCPSSSLPSLIESNPTVRWRRLIVDEADTVTKVARLPRADFTWYVTATYVSWLSSTRRDAISTLFRSLSPTKEERKQADWMDFSRIHAFAVRSEEKFIQASVVLPTPTYRRVRCLTPGVLRVSREFITGEAAECLDAGDVAGAVAHIGGKFERPSDIVVVLTRDLDRRIHNAQAKMRMTRELDIEPALKEERLGLLQEKLRRLRERLDSFRARLAAIDKDECTICFNMPLRGPVVLGCCGRAYCGACILAWFHQWNNSICPVCRQKVEREQIVAVAETPSDRAFDASPPSKLEAVVRIANRSQTKALLFLGPDGALEQVRSILDERQIPYAVLEGAAFHNILRDFREGRYRVLLIKTRGAVAGIGIPEATDVVLYHRLDSALERQAVGRGQRIGRQESLVVHRLEYEGEYPE